MDPSLSLRIVPVFRFFFNDTATTEIYTLSLHDALPICKLLQRGLEGVTISNNHFTHAWGSCPGSDLAPDLVSFLRSAFRPTHHSMCRSRGGAPPPIHPPTPPPGFSSPHPPKNEWTLRSRFA